MSAESGPVVDRPAPDLVFVIGLTPQVVTETLWAVLSRDGLRAMPSRVHLVTTAIGARRIRDDLLGETGALARFCTDFGLSSIVAVVHVLEDGQGREQDDIRDHDDNTRMANLILRVVRELTADPLRPVHASIAGGRKSMSFYMGYGLSLYGRPQDSLSHVLVSEPFEQCPQFWYPTPYPKELPLRNGSTCDAATARVDLAEIPFLPLRDQLDEPLLTNETPDFAIVVADLRRILAKPTLVLETGARVLRFGDQHCQLKPREFSVYQLLAEIRLGLLQTGSDDGWLAVSGWKTSNDPVPQRWIQIYEAVQTQVRDGKSLKKQLDDAEEIWDELTRPVSKINTKLKKTGGDSRLWFSATITRRRRGGGQTTSMRLSLPPEQLKIV